MTEGNISEDSKNATGKGTWESIFGVEKIKEREPGEGGQLLTFSGDGLLQCSLTV